MQHEYHRCPVTALAYLRKTILLAGEGNALNVYQVNPDDRIRSVKVFESQTIHGILVVENTPLVLVWGGTSLRLLSIQGGRRGVAISLGSIHTVNDWILDIAVTCGSDTRKAIGSLITAHNALWTLEIGDVPDSGDEGRVPAAILECAVSGSNCILYSAHIRWLSESHSLVASGTAFGDVILWSAFFDEGCTPRSQVHFTYSAHEGSVFGVQISPLLRLPEIDGERRLLASCSDDRTVRLWDVSDLTTESPALSEVHRDTGFGSRPDTNALAPPLLAKVMGHTSRIWHVRFLRERVLPNDVKLKILSCGEDASANMWEFTRSSSQHPYELQLLSTRSSHSGKNIWSVAQHEYGVLATAGADGAIACYMSPSSLSSTSEISQSDLDLESKDKCKTYAFVSRRHIIATTEQGRVLLIDTTKAGGPTKELSGPLAGLRGYSVMASEGDTSFISGTNGAIYCYAHYEYDTIDAAQSDGGRLELSGLILPQLNTAQLDATLLDATLFDATLLKLAERAGKTAGLFVSTLPTGGVCLLATSVGSSTAGLYILRGRAKWPPFENDGLDKRDLALPHGLVATSLAVCAQTGRWYVFVGSRSGSILVYDLDQSLSDDELLQPRHTQSQVHGKEAVTALLAQRGEKWKYLFSTGRDGTLAIHRLSLSTTTAGSPSASRPPPSLHLVHQISLPFGPNIESLHLTYSVEGSEMLFLTGFRGKDFVCYDTSRQQTTLSVTCGGPHRSWAFMHGGIEHRGGTFVWTQAGKVRCYNQVAQTCRMLDSGGHGREIKAVAVSGKMEDGHEIVATGAEDTDIKLFHLRSEEGGGEWWQCLHTLRKHNTGIQHVAWDGEFLFSSGGFEEFCIWRVTHGVPCLDVGVVCESQHPRSGKSDLRICGFDVRRLECDGGDDDADARIVRFEVCMAYSDSSLKLWRFTSVERAWELVSAGEYLTSCLTHVLRLDANGPGSDLVTAATDGHLAFWPAVPETAATTWTTRHKVHQSAIHALTSTTLPDGSTLIATGGDDNAIALTRIAATHDPKILILPHAHAAAVTGLALVPTKREDGGSYWLVSAGIDQRVKLWEVRVDGRGAGVDGVDVRKVQSVFTPIADASSLDTCTLEDGGTGVVVCGVGTDVWRLPEGDGDETVERVAERA